LYALALLDELGGVAVVLTTDEELGSQTSEGLIEETVSEARAALVLEPSANGALKTERKGASRYRIRIKGRAAHAGLDPERGANAGVELAQQILAIDALGREDHLTTVTPTLASAGTSGNTVPGSAQVEVDVRALSSDELDRVDRELHGLGPTVEGTSLDVQLLGRAPPMPRTASKDLFALARRTADELGIGPLKEASVGGGSDGNFIASLGVPVLDGLGPVGGGAHARTEHVVVSAMPERAALVAALVAELTNA
jgi:glutamate carboxypeptidase